METKIRCFLEAKRGFFLFDPRGTGKSTWVKQHLGDALIVGLLAPEVYRPYSAKPERLREVAEAQEQRGTRPTHLTKPPFLLLTELSKV
jgi:hypothetical protein